MDSKVCTVVQCAHGCAGVGVSTTSQGSGDKVIVAVKAGAHAMVATDGIGILGQGAISLQEARVSADESLSI